jgi:hypothetical protein
MIGPASVTTVLPRAALAGVFVALGFALSGCADMSEGLTTAFADPAKYELWDCAQLEPERKRLADRAAEIQGLMAKAETGTAGPVVAELAYRNEYVAVRGQTHYAEEAWRRNKCRETPQPVAPGPANVRPAPRSKSGTVVY